MSGPCRPPRRAWHGLPALVALLLAACASAPVAHFVPPAERPQLASEQPWPSGHFLAIAYHDIEDSDPDQRFVGITTDQLIEQLNWLNENGYQAVSIDQILAAHAGQAPLPDKAVLISFDDGYASFYTRVLPLLAAWDWPAVLAPVGLWMDTPADAPVDFGGEPVVRGRFLNWEQIAAIARRGRVEIAAHSDRSHHGLLANPQGNTQPAAAARAWLPAQNRYETDAEFDARLRMDVAAISEKIRHATGQPPRVWVWPYGEASAAGLNIVDAHGYAIALTLQPGLGDIRQLHSVARVMPVNAPALDDFSADLVAAEEPMFMRAVGLPLDDLYDPDPEQMERHLGALVQRIYTLRPTDVFLHPLSAGKGERAAYFPNRHLPLRADLFNRVAWQLRNRTQVKIWAVLPVQVEGLGREALGELYADLARHAIFDGVVFAGDAPHALTRALTASIRAIRGPQLKTALTLPAEALPTPDMLDKHLAAFDWLVPVLPANQTYRHLDTLVSTIAAHPGALNRTVFALQTHDTPTHTLAAWMEHLQLRGARHFGYAADDFIHDHPRLADIRPALSAAWYPFPEDHNHD